MSCKQALNVGMFRLFAASLVMAEVAADFAHPVDEIALSHSASRRPAAP